MYKYYSFLITDLVLYPAITYHTISCEHHLQDRLPFPQITRKGEGVSQYQRCNIHGCIHTRGMNIIRSWLLCLELPNIV